MINQWRGGLSCLARTGKTLVVAGAGAALLALAPAGAHAGDLSALQTSVVSTDLFLSWIPSQAPALGLSSGQTAALREIQGDFRSRSEDIGRRIQKDALVLSVEVGKYPIDIKKVKPVLEEISNLRSDLTYHAIKSLYRVQTTMNEGQWEKAKAEWSHILATRAIAPPSKKSDKPGR